MIVEQRQSIRVDDRIVVAWRPADNAELVAYDVREVMLMSVNREINTMISELGNEAPDISRVLVQLNHKLDLLADSSGQSIYGPSLTRINISRSGIAFEWGSEIDVDAIIRITLTLPPNHIKLSIAAKVLACDRMANAERFRIRGIFEARQDEKINAVDDYISFVETMQLEQNKLVAPGGDKPDSAELLHYR